MWIIDNLNMVIILFISLVAFTSGYFQNDFANQSTFYYSEASTLRHEVEQMEKQADFLINFDLSREIQTQSVFDEVYNLQLRYLQAKNNSDVNEMLFLLDEISHELYEIDFWVEDSLAFKIYSFFDNNSNQQGNYFISSQELDGFDFSITYSEYQKSPTIEFNTTMNILEELHFNSEFITDLSNHPGYYTDSPPEHLELLLYHNLDDLLHDPIHLKMKDVFNLEKTAFSYESNASTMALIVSITALTAILAAIADYRQSSVESHNDLQTLKATIDSKEKPEYQHDRISVPILLLSGLLTFIGLLLIVF